MAYTYDRLSGEELETYLLAIEPSDNVEDLISVRLGTACLSSKPEYKALSYAWGRLAPPLSDEWDDPQATRRIMVNRKTLEVRYNLFSAPQAIRRTWLSDDLWWIDAIILKVKWLRE